MREKINTCWGLISVRKLSDDFAVKETASNFASIAEYFWKLCLKQKDIESFRPLINAYLKLVMDFTDWKWAGQGYPSFIDKNQDFIELLNTYRLD